MGRPRIKIIDDSVTVGKPSTKKVKKPTKKEPPIPQLTSPVVKEGAVAGEAISSPSPLPVSAESLKNQKDESVDKKEQTQKKSTKSDQIILQQSRRYKQALAKVDKNIKYPIDDAIPLAKSTSFTNFDGSIEAHLTVSDQGFRAIFTFPHPTGKKRKVLVFADNLSQADLNDNVLVGTDQSIVEILESKLIPNRDFQMVIATPAWMAKLAKIAKILGPKGLMPNPKAGTVTDNPLKTIRDVMAGQTLIRTEEKVPLIHTTIGRVSYQDQQLQQNLRALLAAIGATKVKKLTINATMGPGIKVLTD